ncbi:hypothetical protein [Actinoplanes derwentensis]|uniref:Phosphotyrosine protein phosphatase I domain-containing protein n=1 Tax=Actinoplanes derwentensis TaxID=113562 RepID=A0A1H2DCC0_9ACTN|nr:hypothetical protein [Actinoplanes derwentensis]GID87493.1 hypothetical protein Ade03nite_64170 [Actinoplanes derwentensis]SDT80239.1 hypothetical protein SAMN04489716_9120 [Actinoplanes derwentensis]
MAMRQQRTVLFVCPHGAGKSRIAAAWFTGLALPGWTALSAGIQPQTEVSVHAARLLAGTPVRALLDESAPRPVSAVPAPQLLVAIDCADGLTADVRWALVQQSFDEQMCAEIRDRVNALAATLATSQPS